MKKKLGLIASLPLATRSNATVGIDTIFSFYKVRIIRLSSFNIFVREDRKTTAIKAVGEI